MKILHLCSYYCESKLYQELISDLSNKGIEQMVYVPLKKGGNRRKPVELKNCNYFIDEVNTDLDRINFYRKFRKNYNTLLSNIDLTQIDINHAHTLFTNGAMAYKLYKEKGIPYIVAVRNSDVNTFFKYCIHLRRLGINILKNAEKIIFISPAYIEYTLNKFIPDIYKDEIRKKSVVISNGIHKFWFENKMTSPKKITGKTINLVYVGTIDKNKNVHGVIRDIKSMIDRGWDIKYKIIGDGSKYDEVENLIKRNNMQENVTMYGRVTDLSKLRDILRECDIFVMTSNYETFGLVYIEAMTQGLPIIYTKGQGIDGYFVEGRVGYAVEHGKSIEEKLELILQEYTNMSKEALEVVDDFKWNNVGNKYIDIYNEIYKF